MPTGIYKRKKYGINKICKYCGKKFYVNKYRENTANFCSYSCNSLYHRGTEKIKVICETCKKVFYIHPGYFNHDQRRFCNKKCAYESRKGKGNPNYGNGNKVKAENNPNWRGGIGKFPYSFRFNQQLKDKIRVRDNFVCQLCGILELKCKQRLSIHHKDYDKINCEEENLISLCRKCNARVNFSREKWKEYFNAKN